MEYQLSLKGLKHKAIYPLGDDFRGRSKAGEEISFTNYYMQKNGKPFFGISGEFHFSRMADTRWEDELIKMKMCGINVVATYVFWIHHEEEEGVFDFTGCRNLRKFLRLCKKHGLYVILRVGPFDHGEVRNGGIPDWLYGKPFEVRSLNEGFLRYTRRLYTKIAEQADGMFFKDNGPIIGVQIDNEYMHSSAPWEITAGVSDEWVFGGNEGNVYMLGMKALAAECGLLPAFYTCTGWGGAATPASMMPLWGGYAFRPWIFYSHKGEHPATEEYIYQDFHNNDAVCTNDFKPAYLPEERPYACCEMGGGMMCCYYYRFQYPYKSVDAMANIKLASGCNFLGYYMFQGGSNPTGKHGTFMNEGQVTKISYDYQAALGEFGQVRESYRRLKSLHYFINAFGERLCPLQTVLPEGASAIDPEDLATLRYAVRTDGKSGFLFINNYQDHRQMPDREQEKVVLALEDETLVWNFGIAGDENAILPFHFDMDGIDLVQATAQPVTVIERDGEKTYVFMKPDGMRAGFRFEEGVVFQKDGQPVEGCAAETDKAAAFDVEPCAENQAVYLCSGQTERFTAAKGETRAHVLVISRELANEMYLLRGDRLLFTEEALLEDSKGIRLETTQASVRVLTYPAGAFLEFAKTGNRTAGNDGFDTWQFETAEREIPVKAVQVANGRYTISLPQDFIEDLKDVRLQLTYTGDIGHAFIDGKMIHDNFANGAVWEIGLKEFAERLADDCLTIYITPLKEGANVNVESAMAARKEEVTAYVAELQEVKAQPVYEIRLACKA